MTATYRQRFELTGIPFPKGASDKTFFCEADGYKRLERGFQMLLEEPGLGVLTAEPGVGKTAAIRNLSCALPRPHYRVVYVCDTTIGPLDAYRALALELDLEPAFRRAALWRQLKERICWCRPKNALIRRSSSPQEKAPLHGCDIREAGLSINRQPSIRSSRSLTASRNDIRPATIARSIGLKFLAQPKQRPRFVRTFVAVLNSEQTGQRKRR